MRTPKAISPTYVYLLVRLTDILARLQTLSNVLIKPPKLPKDGWGGVHYW